ncbi:dynein axonemal assembly factor 6 isoform X3 [Heliangelus exortis]|uniref:dynein axonemal assembly factor 6 isoform X3 n=1 Tax=Heliangelus exortis TaxID=472823 RepID=UPI003A915671
MDSLSSGSALQSLAQLLHGAQEEDDDEHVPQHSVSAMTPGSIGPLKRETTGASCQGKSENRKTIWNTEEVPEGSEFDDIWDPREEPEYQILFKQHLGTEDIFFGMNRKDPSTACCEDMVIKIKLPETKYSDITLDIQDTVLDLRTPQNAGTGDSSESPWLLLDETTEAFQRSICTFEAPLHQLYLDC